MIAGCGPDSQALATYAAANDPTTGPQFLGQLAFALIPGLEEIDIADALDEAGASAAAADAGATAARGGVYTLRDEAGNVVRTGRSVNLAARQVAHANDPVLGQFEFQVEYRTDVYAEQRGLEQILYDQYPGAQAANGGYNMIRGISPLNSNGPGYMQAGYDFMSLLGGG